MDIERIYSSGPYRFFLEDTSGRSKQSLIPSSSKVRWFSWFWMRVRMHEVFWGFFFSSKSYHALSAAYEVVVVSSSSTRNSTHLPRNSSAAVKGCTMRFYIKGLTRSVPLQIPRLVLPRSLNFQRPRIGFCLILATVGSILWRFLKCT